MRRIIELCPIFGAKVTSASIRSRFDFRQDPDFFGQIGPDKVRVLLKSLDLVRDCSKVWIVHEMKGKTHKMVFHVALYNLFDQPWFYMVKYWLCMNL